MPTPDSICELVQRFTDNIANYKSGSYNEKQARVEFIDPLFIALGWDVNNAQGYAEAYKDVIHEDKVKVRGIMKAPDYSFRIGMTRKFFVEAKKPVLNLKSDVDSAFQLRRYAWSAKLPLSILTDFEEFAVYDGRIAPKENDGAGIARICYYTYTDYLHKWDEISALFSKEAVLKGAFDRFADDKKARRGTTEVDAAFLAEIEGWRSALAVNLAAKNTHLTIRQLNFAVQKTIDRIIFLRICEDRGIEDMGRLLSLLNGKNVYERLIAQFREADERYNSGLFHFESEKGRDDGERDTLSLTLKVDDGVLKDILKSLYYPSPYAFEVFPADILGQVYEQFLGKVIVLDSKRRAAVEEKPEVRKAGGVYYTPTYIVDYIVQQTVGKLLENKTPKQVETLKILDPACGSGSFLIGAYQKLLDWHLHWYEVDGAEKHAKSKEPKVYQTLGGGWRLTTAERRRILLNNIYGVDIDPQAVEVTKLSLLLKMLEGETQQTVRTQTSLSLGRVLPELGGNIQCGNSLIGSDFYAKRQMTMLDEEEMYRVNAFDWHKAFPFLSKSGGFDAVIGNPPYIFTREQITEAERKYFAAKYAKSLEKQNTFMLFMEQMQNLLKENGLGSYIVPNSWLTIETAKLLRNSLIPFIESVLDLNYMVFNGVSMEPCIYILSGDQPQSKVLTMRVRSQEEFTHLSPVPTDRNLWNDENQRIVFSENSAVGNVIDRIVVSSSTLGEHFDVRSGLQAYEKGRGTPPQTEDDVKDHVFDRAKWTDENSIRYLQGKDVNRYHLMWSGMWMQYGIWLSQPRELAIFQRPRILLREITAEPPHCLKAIFVKDTFLNNKSVINILQAENSELDIKILLGMLNSKLISIYYKQKAVKSARLIFPKIVVNNLREFPYPLITDEKAKLRMVTLVEQMLSLNVKLAAADSTSRTLLQRQIETTDAQIDRLVYALYGLSAEEIAIVEAGQ